MKLVQFTLIGQAAMPVFVNPEKVASLWHSLIEPQ